MSSGPEHYLMAENLLAEVTQSHGLVTSSTHAMAQIAAANAHATLALAAAQAMQALPYVSDTETELAAWREAGAFSECT